MAPMYFKVIKQYFIAAVSGLLPFVVIFYDLRKQQIYFFYNLKYSLFDTI